MSKRPPEPRADLDSTRESRGLADVVNARVRAATASAKEGAKEVERSSRSGEARQAALRLSALVVTSDPEIEAFRFTRRLRLSSIDLVRARTVLDRVNEALMADAATAEDILDRLTRGFAEEVEGASSSGRPGTPRSAPVRRPSIEVVAAPPVSSPVPPELAWSAEVAAPAAGPAPAVAPAAEWGTSLAEEETALGAASSGGAVTRQFAPGAAAMGAGARVTAATPAPQLTVEQHAALAAECDAYPHYRAQIEQRYGIAGAAARAAVDQAWHQRLTGDEPLWRRWHELYATYRDSFT